LIGDETREGFEKVDKRSEKGDNNRSLIAAEIRSDFDRMQRRLIVGTIVIIVVILITRSETLG
jgi:hypothetical protein